MREFFHFSRSVKEFLAANNLALIEKTITVLGRDFALSENPNMRKGGLVGLASVAIGLQGVRSSPTLSTCSSTSFFDFQESKRFVSDLIRPVLTCMSDTDSRVRFYACESLYNVMKVAKEAILPTVFSEIFCAVGVAACDLDSEVRASVELLDRLMKVKI